MSKDVYIVYAKRTAIGSLLGSLSNTSAIKLSEFLVRDLVDKNLFDKDLISEVILGQVLTAGVGQNPARQVCINSGLSNKIPCTTINKVCGSGLQSVIFGAQSIKCLDSDIVIAGGQENMSLAHHSSYLRHGNKFGDFNLVDTMIQDGLWDIFNNYHMGVTAENIAKQYNISRDRQDEFAVSSQKKASYAQKNNKFNDEILPIQIKNKNTLIEFKNDEFIRHDSSIESISKLKPAFLKDGTVTAANSSGINDGAAILALASEDWVKKFNINPIAKIKSYTSVGVDPSIMGIGPVNSIKASVKKAGWRLDDIDLIELNEAFAAQALAVIDELNINKDIINVNGGAIALGHPIGASGARILVTLIHEMKRRNAKKGLAALCIGGGMGISCCIENCES
jgi:acetyl-CoA C-acetyltransferase